jgi:DNA polymerase beta
MSNRLVLIYLRQLRLLAIERKESYRVKAFDGAIVAINKLGIEITDVAQIKGVPGIGKGIFDRVKIILETGGLPEIDVLDPEATVRLTTLELFQSIHGIGPVKAREFYDAGYRTVEQLKESKSLTTAQKVGVSYQEELDMKIPRSEIKAIFIKMCHIVEGYNKLNKTDITMMVAGSYRRRKAESGDIDIVIASRDDTVKASSHVPTIVEYFQQYGVFKEILGMGEVKCLAICQLDSTTPHRRIDLEIVDNIDSWGSCLLYFTGSKELNVRMRELAKSKGWTLNQNGLFDVDGKRFPIEKEEDYFSILGMEYLPPESR